MRASICIATHNRAAALQNTLQSIYCQSPPFSFEVIVVDDGSNDDTKEVCSQYSLLYQRIERDAKPRNPSVARNLSYSLSGGEILILQSDDVMHIGNCIEMLVSELEYKHFVIANVFNTDENGTQIRDNYGLTQYTGIQKKRPLFFLGSLYREDLFAVGGNDEDFVYPGREDVWFALCLLHGAKLTPTYSVDIVGHHQHHPRNFSKADLNPSARLFQRKVDAAMKEQISWKAENSSLNASASTSEKTTI